MFDDYFNEFDPGKRKKILDDLQPENGEEQELEQLYTLFSIRYTLTKQGRYIDRFIGAVMDLLILARTSGGRMSEKKNVKKAQECMHTLCLDRTDEFSQEVLYRELCQLISYYISTCREDSHYQSVIFGVGRISSERLTEKIARDMDTLWEQVETYLGEKKEYLIFKQAITNTTRRELNL